SRRPRSPGGPSSLHVPYAEAVGKALPRIEAVGWQRQRRTPLVTQGSDGGIRNGAVYRVAVVLPGISDAGLLHPPVAVHHQLNVGDKIRLFLGAERRVEAGPYPLIDQILIARRQLAAERCLRLRRGRRGGRHAGR